MNAEAAAEIVTLCAVAKAYVASNRSRDAIQVLDEIKALASPVQQLSEDIIRADRDASPERQP